MKFPDWLTIPGKKRKPAEWSTFHAASEKNEQVTDDISRLCQEVLAEVERKNV